MGRSQTSVAQGDPLSPTLYAIFESALLQELHAGHNMEDSLAREFLALLYADDLVGIAFTAEGLQSDIIDLCVVDIGIGQMCLLVIITGHRWRQLAKLGQ